MQTSRCFLAKARLGLLDHTYEILVDAEMSSFNAIFFREVLVAESVLVEKY